MMATVNKIVDILPIPQAPGATEIPNAISSLAAWKEFQAGMQVLQRYASKSPVDVHDIAKSNLQLLHRSLSYNSKYRKSIKSIQHEGAKSSLPTLRRLYADKELIADILTLQDGASIKLMTLPQRYTMYLLISGNAQLGKENKEIIPAQHWWNRLGAASNKNHLRNGAAIICSDNKGTGQLTASGKNCLVLRINAPTRLADCKMAS